jgi:uncharacterized membrane protein
VGTIQGPDGPQSPPTPPRRSPRGRATATEGVPSLRPAAPFGERLLATEHELRALEERLAPHLAALARHRQQPPRDVNAELAAGFSPLDRLALVVTTKVGTPGFFLIVLAWTVLWLGWNLLAPDRWRFDPGPAFVLWLFVSNMIQILLTPLIMVGQNLLNRRSELRAENDFEINQKAEQEVAAILLRLEQQQVLLGRQEALALEILARVGTVDRCPE